VSVDFGRIKKYSKASNDIDEKLEYLNKQFKKTGLCEIAANSTSGIYVRREEEPNPAHTTFRNASFNGKPFGMTSFSGKSIGGATTNDSGFSFAPDGSGPATSYRGIASGFQPSKPGYQRSPEHRKIGAFLWYWNGSSYSRLEWKYDNQNQGNAGQWAQWKSGAFTPFLDPIIGDASFDPNLLAAIRAAGGGGAAFPDPDDITPPVNLILFQNELEDPDFLPIKIPDFSDQGFNYLKNKAEEEYLKNKAEEELLAGTYDLMKRGQVPFLTPDQVNKILVDPKFQQLLQDDPDLIKQLQRMRASNPNNPFANEVKPNDPEVSYDPFANEVKPNLGAKPGDMLAGFFGGSPEEKAAKELKKVVDKGRSGMFYNNALKFAHQAASPQNYGTASNPRDAAAFIKRYGVTPQQFLKYAASGDVKHLKDKQVDNILNQSYQPEGNVLSEDVKLGHFEPEVLNVDINDIRKGIVPEFPKDPPPEMIDGYSAKSRLVRKNLELPPFIKVTRKDLAKNHKLTDKEIQDFLDDVKRINEYIKKNPAELIYAMTRYPKDDPRLAQLNFKMDEMKRASDQYVETHFPENERLFNKLQAKIKNNIEQTDPNNFTGHKEAPKFNQIDISEQERRRQVIIRHFNKKKS